jgi:hypothetical protein
MNTIRLFGVLLLSCTLANAQTLNCESIAKTLKEYSISTSSSDYLNSVFDQYCEQSGESKAATFNSSADVIIKAVPVKFTGDATATDQRVKNFCKNYSAYISSSERKFTYDEKIASRALDTLDKCMQLSATKGVLITHAVVNKSAINFFMQASATKPIAFSGLTSTGAVTCTGQIEGKLQTFGPNTSLKISATQNIMCTRKSRKQGNNDVFDEATISLATDEGPAYSVLWPRDERLSEDMASEIARSLDGLSGELATLKRDAVLESQIVGLKQTSQEAKRLNGPQDQSAEIRCAQDDIAVGVVLTPGGSDAYARPIAQFQVVCAQRFKPKSAAKP